MRKLITNLIAIVAVAFCLLSFNTFRLGGIRGTVSPLDALERVTAISGKDTLVAEISNGSFSFANVKSTTYTIRIHAKPPYKEVTINNVAVIDSAITDVGNVKLSQ